MRNKKHLFIEREGLCVASSSFGMETTFNRMSWSYSKLTNYEKIYNKLESIYIFGKNNEIYEVFINSDEFPNRVIDIFRKRLK